MLFSLALVIFLFKPFTLGRAQDLPTNGPVYIVQSGDSLWDIALRFGLTLDALEKANGITDPNQLAVNDRLVIPGLEGIQGVLTTAKTPYGENLSSLSKRYRVPVDILSRLNHLTSPDQLYAGSSLIITEQDTAQPGDTPEATQGSAAQMPDGSQRLVMAPGQSLLELAVLRNVNPWSIVTNNTMSGTWSVLPGDVLPIPAAGAVDGPGALPDAIQKVEVRPLPAVQGKATVIKVIGLPGLTLGGSLTGHELNFFPNASPTADDAVPAGMSEYVAMQGIHALATTGLYPLELHGKLPDGTPFSFSQPVFVRSGDYPFDPVLTVSPETIDPAVTKPEDAQWAALAAPVTPTRQWDGIFQSPAPPPFNDCFPSRFGNRRSYNGSAYTYFHSGLDFCGGVGTEIHAPAAGTVVFAGPLTVRGNATLIDHGWGVYTGYLHQSEIRVKPGDLVEPGQVIGLVGGTGRVTGPHLHWEVWVDGVQVDPMDWLQEVFP